MTRPRLAAACAALVLVGASVFGGALLASAAPPPPFLDPTGGTTTNPVPTISGTVTDTLVDQTVTVRVAGTAGTSDYCVAPVPAGSIDAWQCDPATPLDPGTYTFQAFVAEDATPLDLSPGSNTTDYTIGGTQPAAITSPAPGTVSTDATPTFTGTGPSLGSVAVVTGTTTLCTAAVLEDGSWECTATPMDAGGDILPDDYPVHVVGTQLDGATQPASADQTLSISVPDAPTMDYPYGPPFRTGEARPVFSGTKTADTPSVVIWIEIGGGWVHYCETATPIADTTWTCATPGIDLPMGASLISATVRNEFGNFSTFGNELTVERVPAPTITVPAADSYINDTTPAIGGTAGYGTSVDLYYDGEFAACASPTVVGGTFECDGNVLTEGEHTLIAQVDSGSPGNPISSDFVTFTVDTLPPVAPVVETTGTTNDPTPVISGTAEEGATVAVYIDGALIECVTPAVGDAAGQWFCEPTAPLAPGTHTIGAVQTDRAGNPSFVGVPVPTAAIEVLEVEPPSTPVITEPASGTTFGDSVFVGGTVDNALGENLLVRVTGVDAEGAMTECDSTTADSTWGCTLALALGANTITAVAYVDDEVLGEPSATSNTVVTTRAALSKPSVSYSFGPASISLSGAASTGADLDISIYAVTVGEGGGAYSYNTISTCGTDTGGGEGGEGGEGETGLATGPQLEPAVGTTDCTVTALAPGIYNMYSAQRVGGAYSDWQNDYVMIPSTPTFGATVNADRSVTFSGTGTAGYRVFVQGPGNVNVCEAVVGGGGSWSCSANPGEGTTAFRSIQLSQGFAADTGSPEDDPDLSFQGYSAYSAQIAVIVPGIVVPPAAPAPSPTPTPTPTPEPLQPWTFTFSIGATEFEPGDSTTLTGTGLPVGAAVEAEFHSTPVALGGTVVEPSGAFELPVTIPEDAEPGAHKFVVTITPTTGLPSTQEQAVTVKLASKTEASPTRGEVEEALPLTHTAGPDRSDPAAPSGMSHSLKSWGWVIENPAVIGTAAAAGLALLLLVAFPAELLNSTVSEQYPRIARRLPKVKVGWWQRFQNWLTTTPVFGGILVTFLAAFIFGFADPGFGFDITSVRVVLACFLALFVVGYLASSLSGLIIRRRWGLATEIELKPLGLLLAAIGVVLSRLLEFSPGFLLGLILGISLVGNTTVAQRAKATLVQAGVVFVLAMIGWVGYSLLAGYDPDSFLTALANDTLVAITAEGLTALFIGLLPFRYLDGESVFQYSKWIWAACYTVAALAFVLIVVPSSWGEIGGSLPLWIIIVGAFFIVAVGLYLYFRFWAPPIEEDEPADEDREKIEA